MRSTFLLLVAVAAALPAPRDAGALTTNGSRDRRATLGKATARVIPAWARKYNANCSLCHSPAVPRLNAKGIQFKWAGYRMLEEIGEKAEVNNIQEYVAARAVFDYDYEKTQGEPTERSGFNTSNLSLFVGGPIGKSYGGLLELARESEGGGEGEVEVLAAGATAWGNAERFGGLRFGTGHMLLTGGGVAGFDRAIGISKPLPLGEPTATVPLALGGDLTGAEAYFVTGRNRVSVQVLNALAVEEGTTNTWKDIVVTDQFIWDDAGAGVGVAAYFGKAKGVNALSPEATSSFSRVALTANKYFGDFELLGGYVLSRDRDITTGAGSVADNDGSAYWVSGQYTLRPTKWTFFSRWEVVDPNNDESDDSARRFVLGGVLPVNVPEFMKVALEYRLDRPQGAGNSRTNAIAAQFMLTF